MAQNFCILPWKHLVVGTSGTTQVCCVWDDRLRDGASAYSVYDHSVDEIWNSRHMREVRRAMAEGEEIPGCASCRQADEAHGLSYRAFKSPTYEDRPVEELRAEGRRTGYRVDAPPRFLKLDLGNLCNLKCRMCNSRSSSQIARDRIHDRWNPQYEYEADWTQWNGEEAVIGPLPRIGVRRDGFGDPVADGDRSWCWTGERASLDLPLAESTRIDAVAVRFAAHGRRGQAWRLTVDGDCRYEGTLAPGDDEVVVGLDGHHPDREVTVAFECGDAQGLPVEAVSIRRRPTGVASSLPVANRFADDRPWHEQDGLLYDELLKDPAGIDEIYFTGGEPFLIPQFRTVLDHLIDSGHAGRIRLEITTNMSKADDALLAQLSAFQSVALSLSVDGVGPLYEYLRYPGRWDKVQENVERFKSLANGWQTALFAMQIYNVLDTVDLCRFCDRAGINFSLSNVLRYPEYLRIDLLPRRAKEIAAERLRVYARDDCQDRNRPQVLSIADHIEATPDIGTPDGLRTFMLFTNDLDRSRGQSFTTACPELFGLIADTGFKWTDETRYAEASAAAKTPAPRAGTPGVSVVVTDLDRRLPPDRCLVSLREQVAGRVDCEILVASHDPDAPSFGDVRRVDLAPGASTAAARNAAAREARYDWIAFADAGCEMPADWIDTLIGALGQDVDAVAGYPRLPAATSLAGRFATAFTLLPGPYFDGTTLAGPSVGATAIRREVFAAAGGFNPSVAIEAAEFELFRHLHGAGRRIAVSRQWYVRRAPAASFGDLMRRWYRLGGAVGQNEGAVTCHPLVGPAQPSSLAGVAAQAWSWPANRRNGLARRALYSAMASMVYLAFERGRRVRSHLGHPPMTAPIPQRDRNA